MNVWSFEPRFEEGWTNSRGEVTPCVSVWLGDVCVWSKNNPGYAYSYTDDESLLRDECIMRDFAYELQRLMPLAQGQPFIPHRHEQPEVAL